MGISYNTKSDTRSLYIHWPFCPYKCHFCPFVAFAGQDHLMDAYHIALLAEINQFAESVSIKPRLETIFLGGGTPSTYPNRLLLDTFGKLINVFDFEKDIEITIEVNPGTVNSGQLEAWKRAGINRLSIGVQSLKDGVLKSLNRIQTFEQVKLLLKDASTLFENISVDMILGLPGIGDTQWKEELQEIMTWPIKHISLYFLTVHEETPLYFKVKKNMISLPADENVVERYVWSIDFLKNHGFEQYEVSNFSRPGYESKHNSMYWERKPYKGFGVGACSFDGNYRFQNQKNLAKYISDASLQKEVHDFVEYVTQEQIYLEKLMLGLRRTKGVVIHDIMNSLSDEQQQRILQRLTILKEQEFLTWKDDHIILTSKGLAVQNEITVQLFQ